MRPHAQGVYEAVKLQHLKTFMLKGAAARGLSHMNSGMSALVWKLKAGAVRFISTTDTAATLVGGVVLLRWLCDHLEPWGLGEGISLIICSSIATRASSLSPFSSTLCLLLEGCYSCHAGCLHAAVLTPHALLQAVLLSCVLQLAPHVGSTPTFVVAHAATAMSACPASRVPFRSSG